MKNSPLKYEHNGCSIFIVNSILNEIDRYSLETFNVQSY
jgi:hypothetical protein